ncbi:coiled-coil domain-containing protein 149 [Diachasmimorpha longicaudata]|uniref:coiled-coil domain-containing protein 149 n=1 Tax=Diachasmimorpha longicaudata TaxID=58733 RepID=UPI0030B8FF69
MAEALEVKDTEDDASDVIRNKAEVRSEALVALSQELEQCRKQRDQFKMMAEKIQERFWCYKRQVTDSKELRKYTLDGDYKMMDLVAELREQNKCLKLQVETLRQKLGDAQGDIKVLRRSNNFNLEENNCQLAPAVHEREEMIEQLEKLNVKCTQLHTDLQLVLDEKLELETERDAFKCKSHRLNHELARALCATQPVDLDSLINENRYLQNRLQQVLEEKELARQSLSKYKGMLDSKKVKGSIKLGGNGAAGKIMTLKQVEQLLQQGANIPSHKSTAAISDLRCLCSALLEALNDKTLALAHQKKANKILAARICELDTAIPSPTAKLLEGYAGVDVDALEDNLEDPSPQNYEETTLDENVGKNGEKLGISELLGTESLPPKSENETPSRKIQLGLPDNLEALVQKALLNLKENERFKS